MTQTEANTPLIQMESVEKWYGSFQALKDINLTVRKGEKIVLCGPSGSGKSTLIRCINLGQRRRQVRSRRDPPGRRHVVRRVALIEHRHRQPEHHRLEHRGGRRDGQ